MADLRHNYGHVNVPPPSQRKYITVLESDEAGTLWEQIDGKAVEKSLVASYQRVHDVENCWEFKRMFQPATYVTGSSLQMACIRFLQQIGVQGHIRVTQGTPDSNTLS